MIQEFENYLRSIRGFSENTTKAYIKDLFSFARWMQQYKQGARWSTITREDIDEYLTYQTGRGLKPATTNRHLSAISALYRYMQREGLEVENPCKYESRKKIAATIPATIPVEKIAKAYQKAEGVTKTMLGILATTGIRIQELLDMTWEDIDFEHSIIRVSGKGSKERQVSTDAEVLKRLHEISQIGSARGRIFWISQRSARYMIYEALAPFCKQRHLSPHTIRHTYATELAKNGESAAIIAKILGHAHIETSQKYIDMAQVPTPRQGICLTTIK